MVVIGAFFITKERPWQPRGYQNADSVMGYALANDDSIPADMELASVREDNNGDYTDTNVERVFVMKINVMVIMSLSTKSLRVHN